MNKKKILNTSINLLIAFFAGAIPVNILLVLTEGSASPLLLLPLQLLVSAIVFAYLRKAQAK